MADIFDQATEREELDRQIALQHRNPTLPNIGRCYFCNEEITGLFCSNECRNDYEKVQAAKVRNGKR